MAKLADLARGATLSSYDPSFREKVNYWLAKNWYGDSRDGVNKAERLTNILETVTPYGAITGANDAGREAGRGNYLTGGIMLGMAGLPLPSAADKAISKGIRAFHGSPHSFEKFSLDKIGTGEGAQAYGHGLYFAENEGVAKGYRDTLSPTIDGGQNLTPIEARVSQMAMNYGGDSAGAIDWINKNRGSVPALTDDIANSVISKIQSGDVKKGGSMYEVNINANPDDFLDWDKPLSEQTKVAAVAKSFGHDSLDDTGGQFIKQLHSGDWQQKAFLDAGIPGVKYLDAGSRGKGDGSRNYVVFDDKLISVVRKYGIAGATALLGVNFMSHMDKAQAAQLQKAEMDGNNPMSENPFAKFKPTAAPSIAGGNPFAKFKKPVQPQMRAAKPQDKRPQTVDTSGKGDFGLGQGEVAPMTYAEDMAKSTVSGVGSGIAGLLGAPRDIADLTQMGVEYAAGKMGYNGENAGKVFSTINPTSYLPSSSDFQSGVEQTTGEFYRPQTMPGEFARTIGEFAPSAVAGPGGVMRKIAMTVIPAVASEAAGQLTKGTKVEPWARGVAALAGGFAAAGGKGNAVKQIAKNAPSAESVSKQANQMYRDLRRSDIVYDTRQYNRIVGHVADKLKAEGIFPADAPRTAAIVDRLGEMYNGKVTYEELESIRKGANKIRAEGPSISNTDKEAANIVVRALDRFSENAMLTSNGRVRQSDVVKATKQAREMAQRNIIGRDIETMIANSENYQSGQQSGIRNQFTSYLKSKKGVMLRKTDPVMYAAMQRASKGTVVTNLASHLARFGIDPTTGGNIAALLSLGGSGYMASNGNTEGAAALLAAGTVAKFGTRKAALKFAQDAKKVALAGKAVRNNVAGLNAQKAIDVNVRRSLASEQAIQDNSDRNKPFRGPLKGTVHYGRDSLNRNIR